MTSKGVLSRTLALAICALLVVAVYAIGASPLIDSYTEAASENHRLGAAIEIQRLIAARRDALNERLASLRKGRLLDRLLPFDGSDSKATAALQSHVQSVISEAGAELSSVEALDPAEGDQQRRVGLRLRFSSSVDSLREILYGLEYGQPILVLDNLSVQARDVRAVGVINALDVGFEVFAFKPEGV